MAPPSEVLKRALWTSLLGAFQAAEQQNFQQKSASDKPSSSTNPGLKRPDEIDPMDGVEVFSQLQKRLAEGAVPM